MTTELKVYTSFFTEIEVVRLMIEHYGIFVSIGNEPLNRFAMHVSTIVTPYDDDTTVDDSNLIDQQMDTRIFIELLGFRMSCIELMVTQTGINRCL